MRQQGFTLIEILISLAIFTLIGLASTGLLTTVIDSSELSSERFAKLQQLQRAMITIERDIQQAMLRPVRLDGDANDIVIRGGEIDDSDASGLAFVRGGWHNPQFMLPRSTLQLIAYRLNDTQLERVYGNYLDNVIGFEPKTRVLLDNVSDFQIEFIPPASSENQGNSKALNWVPNYTGTALPLGIAITITSDDFGEIRREFALGNGGLS